MAGVSLVVVSLVVVSLVVVSRVVVSRVVVSRVVVSWGQAGNDEEVCSNRLCKFRK